MLKRLFRSFGVAICALAMLSFTACSTEDYVAKLDAIIGSGASAEAETIMELNQPYEGSALKITATEIKTAPASYENDKIVIGVKFDIENVSSKDSRFSVSSISPYVDDVAVSNTYGSDFGDHLSSATIAPGKRALGYFYVKAPKDAEIIELHYRDNYAINGGSAVFIFDIPPVED